MSGKEKKLSINVSISILFNYLSTFSTRIVAGELTTESLRLRASISGSSRGFEDADVAN